MSTIKNVSNQNVSGQGQNIGNNATLLYNFANNGSDLYYNQGSLIVGKTYKNSSNYAIDVSGIINSTGLYVNNLPVDLEGVVYASSLIVNNVELVPVWSAPNSSNGSTFYNSGNVGVKTSTPLYPLDVGGVINSSSDIRAGGNMLCSGLVGIGNSTPAYNLDVSGNERITGTLYTNNIRPNSGTVVAFGNRATIFDDNTNVAFRNVSSNGALYLQTGSVSQYSAILKSNGDFTVNNGKLGVGTSSPTYNLDVSGIICSTGNIYCGSKLGIGTTTPAYPLQVVGSINSTVNTTNGVFSAGYGDFLSIEAFDPSNAFTKKNVNINAYGGNVGIGNASPSYRLDVSGDARVSNVLYVSSYIDLGYNDTSRAPNSGKIIYGASWDPTALSIVGAGSGAGKLIRLYDNVIVNGSVTANSINLNTAPMFSAYGANLLLTANVYNTIIQPSVEYNIGSCYNSSTGSFTPNLAGYYEIKASAFLGGSSSAGVLAIFKNGSIHRIIQSTYTTSNDRGLAGSCIVYCNGTTDYIQMKLAPNGPTTSSSQIAWDWFTGYYLRSG